MPAPVTTLADPTTLLGQFPMTFADGTWSARCFEVELDEGKTWTVSLSLACEKVVIYAYDDEGLTLHGHTGYAPTLQVGDALRNALSVARREV